MNPEVDKLEISSRANGSWRLLLTASITCMGSLMVGLTGGYPSPAIPDLNAHPNPVHVNADAQSWFSSVGYLGAILGALLSSFLIDRLGRKLGMMAALVPYTLGWIAIAAAYNKALLFVGRFLTGMSSPIIFIAINVYIVEIAPPSIRGMLVTFNQLFLQTGIFTIYLAGWYIHWNWLTIVCASPSILLATFMAPLPETPRWLFMKKRPEAALQSLEWFRGAEEPSLQAELKEIQESLQDCSRQESFWKDSLGQPLVRRFAISLFLFVFQEFSGINIIRTYTVTIFQSTEGKSSSGSGSLLDAYGETVVIGAAMVLSSILSIVFIDRFRRRVLFIASFMLMALGMASLGTFFLLLRTKHKSFGIDHLWWLPLLSLAVYTLAYSIGCGPLPHAITNELFPTRARGRSYSWCMAADYAFGFLVIKCFPYLNSALGDYGTFWTFASVCCVGAAFVFFFVPETIGRSLEQLEQTFQHDDSINS